MSGLNGSSAAELRERILGAGRRLRIVPIETYHAGWIWIRELTGTERDQAQAMAKGGSITDEPGWRGRLAALYLCDENGQRLFDPLKDFEAINALPGDFVEEILNRGAELAKMGSEAIEEAKANFRAARSVDSSSGSSVTLVA